jgi:hypothetical protein
MSERNGTVTTAAPGTMPIVVADGGTTTAPPTTAPPTTAAPTTAPPDAAPEAPAGVQPTAPVTVRPAPRGPRRGPLTLLGPWAPVAGGLLGLAAGAVVALVLGGVAASFEDRLGLVLVVVGLGLLGVSGTLLADEVRMVRHGAREAALRPGRAEATAGLLHGVTPARLMLVVSGFVLFLAVYASRG